MRNVGAIKDINLDEFHDQELCFEGDAHGRGNRFSFLLMFERANKESFIEEMSVKIKEILSVIRSFIDDCLFAYYELFVTDTWGDKRTTNVSLHVGECEWDGGCFQSTS
jgi:hypothetical protein